MRELARIAVSPWQVTPTRPVAAIS